MLPRIVILAATLTFAVAGDMLRYRISNVAVAAGLAAGFIVNMAAEGAEGLITAFLGAVLPVILLFILFALRMLGAGDIKLFSAVGSIMGVQFTAYAAAYSFLAAGIMALLIMLARGIVGKRLMYIATYLKTVFLSQSFPPYSDFGDKSDGAKFHFSPAIAAGCCLQVISMLISGS